MYGVGQNAPCIIRTLDDRLQHCIPASTLSDWGWGASTGAVDPAVCFQLLVDSDDCVPATLSYTATGVHKAIPAEQVVGTAFDTAEFRECLSSARKFMKHPYAVTEPVAADEFPRMGSTEVAQGTLSASVLGSADGTVLSPIDDSTVLHGSGSPDARLYCLLQRSPDGSTHCLPSNSRAYLFADPECTEVLLSTVEPYTVWPAPDGGARVYVAGEPYSGPVYHDATPCRAPEYVCPHPHPSIAASLVASNTPQTSSWSTPE